VKYGAGGNARSRPRAALSTMSFGGFFSDAFDKVLRESIIHRHAWTPRATHARKTAAHSRRFSPQIKMRRPCARRVIEELNDGADFSVQLRVGRDHVRNPFDQRNGFPATQPLDIRQQVARVCISP